MELEIGKQSGRPGEPKKSNLYGATTCGLATVAIFLFWVWPNVHYIMTYQDTCNKYDELLEVYNHTYDVYQDMYSDYLESLEAYNEINIQSDCTLVRDDITQRGINCEVNYECRRESVPIASRRSSYYNEETGQVCADEYQCANGMNFLDNKEVRRAFCQLYEIVEVCTDYNETEVILPSCEDVEAGVTCNNGYQCSWWTNFYDCFGASIRYCKRYTMDQLCDSYTDCDMIDVYNYQIVVENTDTYSMSGSCDEARCDIVDPDWVVGNAFQCTFNIETESFSNDPPTEPSVPSPPEYPEDAILDYAAIVMSMVTATVGVYLYRKKN